MLFKIDNTFEEMLSAYGQASIIDKVPVILRNERIGIFGANFYKKYSNIVVSKNNLDKSLLDYLVSQRFLDDLEEIEIIWKNRRTDINYYMILLELIDDEKMHLRVEAEMKECF